MEIITLKAGRELDALVAEKVMGWTTIDATKRWDRWAYGDSPQDEWTNIEEEWCRGVGIDSHDQHPFLYPYPRYSVDIAASWAVVEKLENWHGFQFMCRLIEPECRRLYGGKWYAGWFEDSHDGPESRATAEADTAPLAICLAALRAVSHE